MRTADAADAAPGPGERAPHPMWWTRRALALHATIVLVVPAFLALFWWQVQRVREGNTLSWAYVFEWPFFTGYAIYLWWKLVHDQPDQPHQPDQVAAGSATAEKAVAPLGAAAPVAPAAVAPAVAAADSGGASAQGARTHDDANDANDADDDELAAYNRYLAELNASGRRKTW